MSRIAYRRLEKLERELAPPPGRLRIVWGNTPADLDRVLAELETAPDFDETDRILGVSWIGPASEPIPLSSVADLVAATPSREALRAIRD